MQVKLVEIQVSVVYIHVANGITSLTYIYSVVLQIKFKMCICYDPIAFLVLLYYMMYKSIKFQVFIISCKHDQLCG